jgi:hypothetical protein
MSFGKYGREHPLDDLQPSILSLEDVYSIPNRLLLKKELSVQLGLYGNEFISHFAKDSFEIFDCVNNGIDHSSYPFVLIHCLVLCSVFISFWSSE